MSNRVRSAGTSPVGNRPSHIYTTGGYAERFSADEPRKNSATQSKSESGNYGGEVETTNNRPKRVRNRKASLQLQAALNDAEQLDGFLHDELTIARMKLI